MKDDVFIEGEQFIEVSRLDLEYLSRFDEPEIAEDFNLRFLLALDCYMGSVAKKMLEECKEDVKLFGFKYVKEKWETFIKCSLTGEGGEGEAVS